MSCSGGHNSFWVFGEIVHLDTIQGRGHESRIRGLHPYPLMECPGAENCSFLKTCENMISWSSHLHPWSPSTSPSLCVSFEPRTGSVWSRGEGGVFMDTAREEAGILCPTKGDGGKVGRLRKWSLAEVTVLASPLEGSWVPIEKGWCLGKPLSLSLFSWATGHLALYQRVLGICDWMYRAPWLGELPSHSCPGLGNLRKGVEGNTASVF